MYPEKAGQILEAINLYEVRMEAIKELANSLRSILGPTNYSNFINSYFSSFNPNLYSLKPKINLDSMVNVAEKQKLGLTWHWSVIKPKSILGSKAPSPRWGHSSIIYKNQMIVFGGTGAQAKTYNDVYICDINDFIWKKINCVGIQPQKSDSHTMTIVEGKTAYVFGGTYNDKRLNELYSFDLAEYRWSKVKWSGNPPSPREGHSATLVSSHEIFFFGGVNNSEVYSVANLSQSQSLGSNLTCSFAENSSSEAQITQSKEPVKHYELKSFNNAYILDLEYNHWYNVLCEPMYPFPSKRDSHSAVSVSNDVYIFGGIDSNENNLNELYRMEYYWTIGDNREEGDDK